MATETQTKHMAEEVWRRNRIALAQLMRLVEDGVLVRNINNDRDIKKYLYDSTILVMALKQAQDALELEPSDEMFVALAKLICPACDHELQHHLDKFGCEVERGDHEGNEGEPAYALPPCGCNEDDLRDDYPDMVRALKALREAKQARP